MKFAQLPDRKKKVYAVNYENIKGNPYMHRNSSRRVIIPEESLECFHLSHWMLLG